MSAPETTAPRDRTPIVLGIIAGVLAIAVVVVLALYFLRPTSPAASGTTPSPQAPASTPDDSEQDESDPPPTTASGIEVTSTGFTITGEDGESFTHAWADDAQPAIDALTALFGAEPTEDFQNGDAKNWAYTIYEWTGFRLYDVYLDGSNRERSEVPAPTYVSFGTGVPVDVSDDFGIELGMTPDELDALGPDKDKTRDGTTSYLFGEDRATFYNDGARTFGAIVTQDADSLWVTYTYAPKL